MSHLVLSRKIVERLLISILSLPGDRWCHVLRFQWCPQACLKLLSTSYLPRCKPLVMAALPASLSDQSFPYTPACPRQYTERSFRMRMSNTDTHGSLAFSLYYRVERAASVFNNNKKKKIIIIDNFCIALFSGLPILTALYNILQHFLSFTNIIHIIMTTSNV